MLVKKHRWQTDVECRNIKEAKPDTFHMPVPHAADTFHMPFHMHVPRIKEETR